MRAIQTVILALLLSACDPSSSMFLRELDACGFRFLGGTLFSSALEVSIKQILLDHPSLLKRQVVVEGEVVELGDYGTYLIVSHNSDRLLVVVTSLANLSVKKQLRVKILGMIENERGLPFLRAKAVKEI